MDNVESESNHICGVMLSAFTDVIRANGLEELKPLHLKNFKYSEYLIFESVGLECADSLDSVKQYLKPKLQAHIYSSNLTPESILDGFCAKILDYRQGIKELHEPELWVSFLEFIAVQLIVKPPKSFDDGWDSTYMQETFDEYRFFYSNTITTHRSIYREIVAPSNLRSLGADTKIILFVSGDAPDSPLIESRIMKKTKQDISRGLEEKNIVNVKANLSRSNELIHWGKLNDICLGKNEGFYSDLNLFDDENDIHNSISSHYGAYLKKGDL